VGLGEAVLVSKIPRADVTLFDEQVQNGRDVDLAEPTHGELRRVGGFGELARGGEGRGRG
jgi:hypothetical protein